MTCRRSITTSCSPKGDTTRTEAGDPPANGIGETDNLRSRLTKFITCATTRWQEGHMAGWRYAFLRLNRHFPLESLRIRWKAAASKEAARELEGTMMVAYLARHCELPPLNYSFNWLPFEKYGWDLFDRAIDWREVADGGGRETQGPVAGPNPQ